MSSDKAIHGEFLSSLNIGLPENYDELKAKADNAVSIITAEEERMEEAWGQIKQTTEQMYNKVELDENGRRLTRRPNKGIKIGSYKSRNYKG